MTTAYFVLLHSVMFYGTMVWGGPAIAGTVFRRQRWTGSKNNSRTGLQG